jgi:hypothetical protein
MQCLLVKVYTNHLRSFWGEHLSICLNFSPKIFENKICYNTEHNKTEKRNESFSSFPVSCCQTLLPDSILICCELEFHKQGQLNAK